MTLPFPAWYTDLLVSNSTLAAGPARRDCRRSHAHGPMVTVLRSWCEQLRGKAGTVIAPEAVRLVDDGPKDPSGQVHPSTSLQLEEPAHPPGTTGATKASEFLR